MIAGAIIILNGASSSGKSSLAKSLQAAFPEPFLSAGLDSFLWMLPHRYLDRPLWDDVLGLATEAGETGHRLVRGMHRAISELARAGNHVVADHVLVEPSWLADCAMIFAEFPAWFVGVRCPLAVLEERERKRGDRTLGQAAAQHELVHVHGVYDIEVDTSRLTPDECAVIIRRTVESGAPFAFKRLRDRRPPS
jgi:chloramphenicol 3-O phosphotransferase